MDIRTSHYCCGLYEIGGFADPYKVNLEEYKSFGKIATTIASQKAGIEWLKANGFTVVSKFKNPNSGNIVSLWFSAK